jgi:hypothetical protein
MYSFVRIATACALLSVGVPPLACGQAEHQHRTRTIF